MSRCFRPPAGSTRIIGALLLALLLAGCGAVRLSYNNATALSYWWLDGYADFDHAQERQLREQLGLLHAWHRAHELPLYAALLAQGQQLFAGAVSAPQVCQLGEQIRERALRLSDQAALGLAEIVTGLKPAQFSAMRGKFDKTNRKWREEWLDGSPAELAAARLKKAVERAEQFYGRLDDAQIALLRQAIAASSFDPRVAWAERQRRQQDMLQVLREHGTGARAAHLQDEMRALLRRNLESPEPAYRAQAERQTQENCQLIAALHNSASPAQRRHLLDKLRGYEADARVLAAQN